MRVLLVSTYELGHQPLHLASPAGVLGRAGHEVTCLDLAVEPLRADLLEDKDAVAVSVPMHTAMRLARRVLEEVRRNRPELPVCFYGLYASMDIGSRTEASPDFAVAGEYERPLSEWVDALGKPPNQRPSGTVVSLERTSFGLPERKGLAPLERYSRLVHNGEEVVAGYVEASHGCSHRCRHCPVPVVYDGRTRLVGIDTVLADVEQQVVMGARHITFGDPDFLNGPHHARRILEAVSGAFPALTFDVTVKVEHILRHAELWGHFATMGCLFVVSAFESATDSMLELLDKGHTVEDEIEAVRILRNAGIEPRPSLLPFTPWTAPGDLVDLLDLVAAADLVGNIDAVHYSIRLLVPRGSLLLEELLREDASSPCQLEDLDPDELGWTWRSSDPRLDELQLELASIAEAVTWDQPARDTYRAVRKATCSRLGLEDRLAEPPTLRGLRSPVAEDVRPKLTEAWFCCAEPTASHFVSLGTRMICK